MLGGNVKFVLTREKNSLYSNGRIDEKFILKNVSDFNRHFYVCGPDPMVGEILEALKKLGASADALVFEK